MAEFKCPNCNNEVSLFTFIKAPTPWHIQCNSCKTKIKLEKFNLSLLFIAFFIGFVLGFSYIELKKSYDINLLLMITFIVFIVLIFEILAFFILKGIGIGFVKRN